MFFTPTLCESVLSMMIENARMCAVSALQNECENDGKAGTGLSGNGPERERASVGTGLSGSAPVERVRVVGEVCEGELLEHAVDLLRLACVQQPVRLAPPMAETVSGNPQRRRQQHAWRPEA